MDSIDLLRQAYAWTADRIANVRPDDLQNPTPCAGWTLADLLNHLLGAIDIHTQAISGTAIEMTLDELEALPHTDRIGDDPAAAFDATTQRALAAWNAPGALDRVCHMPFGPMAASLLAILDLSEVVVHGWDIGQATHRPVDVPDALAAAVLDSAAPLVELQRGVAYGPAVTDAGTSATQRLVAYFGRKPVTA
ncbi:MAG TPA: TIGR03086 family metal-binding protein [Mycobacterium sp.]|nr:TIGR03086 family metal-binding protein [Mycobacterium sp.]